MDFMNRKLFKLSVVSSAILATTQVSAALYNVVEVSPNIFSPSSYKSSYGVAIEPVITNGADDNCFESTASVISNCDSFNLAGETRLKEMNTAEAVDGLSFREEAPFAMDNRFDYIQTSDKFKSYCNSELRYSTCNAWASPRWSAWSNEKSSTVPNSIAFMGSGTTGTPIDSGETLNVVINAIAPSVTPIGIDSQPANISGNVRQSVVARSDVSPPSGYDQTRAWASDGTYTVGSVSEYGTSYYRSHAAIWTSSSVAEIPWGSGASSSSTDHYAQGSIRDFVVEGSDIYGVGYNSYSSNNYMNATVFKIADDFSLLESIVVSNTQVKIDGNTVHSNSVVTSVNNNFVAIGSAKRAGNKPKSNAAANRLFIIDDVRLTNISANFPSGGILFDGAGGKAGAINNYNEIVGQIDIENTREVDGKPRRKRGFIYPYNAAGSDSTRMTRFANKAWYLDDLTNDGSLSGNNQYRVVDATDINDAGVISATALKCSGGYDTTAHNSTCGGGSQTETTVAVKLVPIVGATASDISERGIDTTTSERSGGSLGLWSLILLTLGWFRRK